ncbi:MAG: HAMP domain-containing sensor histidine kinase [Myxococcota bacterium]|nr:HAMP domain-containing sensor histidine kinase [Myxococcota bacterium]
MTRTERRSIRLRLAVASLAWVAGASVLLIGAFYAWSIDRPRQQVDSELGQELRELASHYQTRGARALASEVARRVDQLPAGNSLYLYAESQRTVVLEGSLESWPEGFDEGDQAQTIPIRTATPHYRIERQIRMLALTLDDGRHLAVGRDISEHARFQRTLQLAAVGSLALVVFGGLAAGLGVSRNLLGRVEAMRDTIVGILGGRRQERVPVRSREGAFDEFDELADQFNRLLDDNERLLVRMREVTDDVAHDLRSPLSRMRARIEATLVTRPSAEDQTETLHAMLAEIDGMLDTFNALVHIAQIESRSVQEHMEILDLDEQAADAAELYQPVAEEAGLAFHTALAGGLRIRGNRHLLSQALTNLLDNAIKYSDEPGEVTLESRRVGEHVEICVADRGPGIPEADRERVLQRFVRLDASRRTAGTGLGLSFVAAVADLHEATLRIEDNAPGLRVTLRFESV